MKKLGKQQEQEKARHVQNLLARQAALDAAITAFNEAMQVAKKPVEEALAALNEAINDADSWRQEISLAQESKDIPMLRKLSFYSSYVEGWALYSEQLADELGGYKEIEKGGYLQSFLFRSARLVVDTGLNSKGWSREQAVDYMTKTTGFPRARVQREVERYCISIGQACSYKVGHLAWLRAREKAKSILGAKFDIKQFHEVLKDGSMPLTILERRVEERARALA